MQDSFKEIISRYSEIQNFYWEFDEKISNFLTYLKNMNLTFNARISEEQIHQIINGVLGGRKCVEEKDVHSVDSVDADIKEGGQNA